MVKDEDELETQQDNNSFLIHGRNGEEEDMETEEEAYASADDEEEEEEEEIPPSEDDFDEQIIESATSHNLHTGDGSRVIAERSISGSSTSGAFVVSPRACEKHRRWKKRCPQNCPMRAKIRTGILIKWHAYMTMTDLTDKWQLPD